jgi:YidC/Oxa1 family membrane protein insertase
VVWFNFFPPQSPQVKPTVKESEITEKNDQSLKELSTSSSFDASKELQAIQSTAEEKIIKVDTPMYKAEFSNRGAVVKQFELKKFKETNRKDSELKYLIDKSMTHGTYGLSFKNSSIKGIEDAFFTPDLSESDITVNDKKQTLTRFLFNKYESSY